MELKKQVTSLKLSKRLKQLRVLDRSKAMEEMKEIDARLLWNMAVRMKERLMRRYVFVGFSLGSIYRQLKATAIENDYEVINEGKIDKKFECILPSKTIII